MQTLSFDLAYRYDTSPSGIEIPVRISADRDRSVNLLAKVDTGAECCIFQREYADLLDLSMEEGERKMFATATGALETRGFHVTLSTFDYGFESLVYFAAEEGLPRNVLGLQGWLEKLRFGLVHYDRSIYVSRYDE